MTHGRALGSCAEPLWSVYDVAMLDLDGVVYVGPDAVDGAAGHLAAAAAAGMSLAYVTNNASRPPRVVAEHLVRLGMPAGADDVVTSAQAAARLVADAVPRGAAVFVIGGAGLDEALEERGLKPVRSLADEPAAVVSGYHPDLRWKTVIDGAILVRKGVPWFASNTDLTVPTPHGPGPGNGALVGAVARFAGVDPVVAGKPEPPLFHETRRRVGGRRPLVVGDRLDTDIEGAARAGYDSLLVMTGVTGVAELVAAAPGLRPTYLSMTLAGLGAAHPAPTAVEGGWSCGGWSATTSGTALVVEGDGTPDDWLRVAAAAAWNRLDTHGEPVSLDRLELPAG
jgi:HAD superfamily hydrolase (TIGR01450 family)